MAQPAVMSPAVIRVSGQDPDAQARLAEVAALSDEAAARTALLVDQTADAQGQAQQAIEQGLLAIGTTLPLLVIKQGALGPEEVELALGKLRDGQGGAALKTGAGMGLARYLAAAAAPPQRIVLTHSTDRGAALEQLQGFVMAEGQGGLDPRRVAQFLTVADELITNAFYHAPVDGIGGHPYSHVSRMDLVQCKPGREIELAFARDEQRVAVSVRDRYGSLKQPQLRAHLARAATAPMAHFKASGAPGGAKLGLVTALRAASQLVFNVIPGESTEGIGIVEARGTYRQFVEAGRALHLFYF